MVQGFLYDLSLPVIFVIWLATFLCASAAGYSLGRYFVRRNLVQDEISNFVPSTVLGLLALVLGFTFSIAMGRYDHRAQLVAKEANAVGTAYLRAQTLPEPYKTRIKENIKKYVDVRLKYYDLKIFNENRLREVDTQTIQLQDLIWEDVVALTQKNRDAVTGLFVAEMNEAIDLSEERTFATDYQVPELAYYIIGFITVVGLMSLGFMDAIDPKESKLGLLTLSILFSIVIVLIQDLDRPRRGLISVSQRPLYDLQENLKTH